MTYFDIPSISIVTGFFTVVRFAVGQFAVRTLCRGTVHRKDTLSWNSSPQGQFAVGTHACKTLKRLSKNMLLTLTCSD